MSLKKIRIAHAVLMLSLITFYFLDFANVLPTGFKVLTEIQFLPALLAGSLLVVLILILLTFLFGRIYCSVICPLGIFQDVISWFSRSFKRKKKHSFSKEKKILRYGFLVATVLAFLVGGNFIVSLLDPYSAYGRITTHLFRPVYLAVNNSLAYIFNLLDNYTFYNIQIYILSISSLIIGILTFLLIGFLSWRYGRTYCNTICPVGTFLGMISRHAVFKVHIQETSCNHCGLCEKACKASCIDSKNQMVDYSRCVTCYDCLNVCKTNAITFRYLHKSKKPVESVSADNSRRTFLTAVAATALIIPAKMYAKGLAGIRTNTSYSKKHPLSPPGSKSAEHLQIHCTACHLCVAKCPSRVLKPAFTEYGLEGLMQPRMDFEHGFCNYDCTVCSSVCPNGALEKLTKAEKQTLQMGKVIFVKSNCVVFTDETSCGACSEHCPTQAVSMIPYKNGLTIPSVNTDICVGCGGCEYICPVRPFRAIYIEGNPVHLQASRAKEAAKKVVKLDDFGF